MNIEEFKQLYEECGEVVAKLRISELDAPVNVVAHKFPQALPLLGIKNYAWANLLIVHPEVQEYCKFEQFDGHCWSWLLAAKPEFARNDIWHLLSGPDWYFLLVSQPDFTTAYQSLSAEKRAEVEAETPMLKELPSV